MIDIRFNLSPATGTQFETDHLRLMVVTERNNNSNVATNLYTNYTLGLPTNDTVPIDTKYWKIHMDKYYQFSSGQVPINSGTVAYRLTQKTKNRCYRFIIPFKQLANVRTANWRPEQRTYILATTGNNATMLIDDTSIRYYFIDP